MANFKVFNVGDRIRANTDAYQPLDNSNSCFKRGQVYTVTHFAAEGRIAGVVLDRCSADICNEGRNCLNVERYKQLGHWVSDCFDLVEEYKIPPEELARAVSLDESRSLLDEMLP